MSKGKGIDPGELHPDLARGLTQGASAEEAAEEHGPVSAGDGRQYAAQLREGDKQMLSRDGLPWAPMVAANDTQAVWNDGVTDRPQMDLSKTYTELGLGLLREGRQCLRCDEPHPEPFPELCDLCGYPMNERQIMDIAMEFEGTKHIGPSRPITEYMAEQDARLEKAKFDGSLAGKGR